MEKALCLIVSAVLLALLLAPSAVNAEDGTFTDTRFQGAYTTENLDAILEE